MIKVGDLRSAGFSSAAIQQMRRANSHLTWGAYTERDLSPEQRYRQKCLAVLSRLKDGAALAGPSAAVFLDLPLVGQPPEKVYVRNICRGTYSDELRVLRPGATQIVNGIPMSTPVEIVADCSRLFSPRDALILTDGALAAGLCQRDHLWEHAGQLRGKPGASRFRWLARNADPLAQSPGETWTRLVGMQLGYDLVSQFHVSHRHREAWLDFLVRGTKTALEFDGLGKYTNVVQKVVKERLRQGDLEELGYRFTRFVWHQLPHRTQFDKRLRAAGAVPTKAPDVPPW